MALCLEYGIAQAIALITQPSGDARLALRPFGFVGVGLVHSVGHAGHMLALVGTVAGPLALLVSVNARTPVLVAPAAVSAAAHAVVLAVAVAAHAAVAAAVSAAASPPLSAARAHPHSSSPCSKL